MEIKVFKSGGDYYALLAKEHTAARDIVKTKYSAKFVDVPSTNGEMQKA